MAHLRRILRFQSEISSRNKKSQIEKLTFTDELCRSAQKYLFFPSDLLRSAHTVDTHRRLHLSRCDRCHRRRARSRPRRLRFPHAAFEEPASNLGLIDHTHELYICSLREPL